MGVWGSHVLPRLVDRALQHPRGECPPGAGLLRPPGSGAGDRLRFGSQRGPLPGVGRPRCWPSSRPIWRGGSLSRGSRPAGATVERAGLDGEQLAVDGRVGRRRALDLHPVQHSGRGRGPAPRSGGCSSPTARCTSSSTAWRPTTGRAEVAASAAAAPVPVRRWLPPGPADRRADQELRSQDRQP